MAQPYFFEGVGSKREFNYILPRHHTEHHHEHHSHEDHLHPPPVDPADRRRVIRTITREEAVPTEYGFVIVTETKVVSNGDERYETRVFGVAKEIPRKISQRDRVFVEPITADISDILRAHNFRGYNPTL